jgi:hypothetical protein
MGEEKSFLGSQVILDLNQGAGRSVLLPWIVAFKVSFGPTLTIVLLSYHLLKVSVNRHFRPVMRQVSFAYCCFCQRRRPSSFAAIYPKAGYRP